MARAKSPSGSDGQNPPRVGVAAPVLTSLSTSRETIPTEVVHLAFGHQLPPGITSDQAMDAPQLTRNPAVRLVTETGQHADDRLHDTLVKNRHVRSVDIAEEPLG